MLYNSEGEKNKENMDCGAHKKKKKRFEVYRPEEKE